MPNTAASEDAGSSKIGMKKSVSFALLMGMRYSDLTA